MESPENIANKCDQAVSVSLPTWKANVGYEEGEDWVLSKMTTGYPRWVSPIVVCKRTFHNDYLVDFSFTKASRPFRKQSSRSTVHQQKQRFFSLLMRLLNVALPFFTAKSQVWQITL